MGSSLSTSTELENCKQWFKPCNRNQRIANTRKGSIHLSLLTQYFIISKIHILNFPTKNPRHWVQIEKNIRSVFEGMQMYIQSFAMPIKSTKKQNSLNSSLKFIPHNPCKPVSNPNVWIQTVCHKCIFLLRNPFRIERTELPI